MDIRYFFVGAPFIIAFFYTLFWLKRWGAFDSSSNHYPNKMTTKNDRPSGNLILENIFLRKIKCYPNFK